MLIGSIISVSFESLRVCAPEYTAALVLYFWIMQHLDLEMQLSMLHIVILEAVERQSTACEEVGLVSWPHLIRTNKTVAVGMACVYVAHPRLFRPAHGEVVVINHSAASCEDNSTSLVKKECVVTVL